MISYAFAYDDGFKVQYELDENAYFPEDAEGMEGPWLDMEAFRCGICTLEPREGLQCPAAQSLWPVLQSFSARISHEPVRVTVQWSGVQMEAAASTQQAVRSLVGLTLALSRCPVMERLRPMAHFHLPFGSMEHTQFRALGMYLIAQFIRNASGLAPDWNLGGLLDLYKNIQTVNRKLAERIRAASEKDATVNGLIILDALAQSVEMGINQNLKKLKPLFEMYLRD